MHALQVLTVNWNHIFNFVVLALSFGGFLITYNKYMKRTVNMEDIDKLEKKIDSETGRLSSRVDRLEDQIHGDIKEIKEAQRDILNHIINCTKR